MKRLLNIVKILMLTLPVILNAQGWNSIVTTSSTVDYVASDCFYLSFAELDQFVNSAGVHLVVADDDGISYKKFSSSGAIQSSSSISTSGKYPTIVGDEDDLYIVYLSGSYIYLKKSTNDGSTWAAHDDLYIGLGN